MGKASAVGASPIAEGIRGLYYRFLAYKKLETNLYCQHVDEAIWKVVAYNWRVKVQRVYCEV